MHTVYVGEWKPIIKNIPHHIFAIFTVCKAKNTQINLSDEHDAYEWVDPQALPELNITAADRTALEQYNKQKASN